MKPTLFTCVLAISLSIATAARAEEIKVASYNIEWFNNHFMAHRLQSDPIGKSETGKEVMNELRKKNDEDNWETAQVILDPKFLPDILAIEEGCDQSDLDFFNHRWLNDAYETVIQFNSNSGHHQNLDLLMKKGFKILERKDKYYLEPDPIGNERGERLFARGPVFIKVKSPGGYVFWFGLTHMKSKGVFTGGSDASDPSNPSATPTTKISPAELKQKRIDAAKWRAREAARTHEIMKELVAQGPKDLILVGDMNDSVGLDDIEPEGGGDSIAILAGPPADGFYLATKPLHDKKINSFGGYYRDRYRELIDHVIVSPSMKGKIKDVEVFHNDFTAVSSDHFPVLVELKP